MLMRSIENFHFRLFAKRSLSHCHKYFIYIYRVFLSLCVCLCVCARHRSYHIQCIIVIAVMLNLPASVRVCLSLNVVCVCVSVCAHNTAHRLMQLFILSIITIDDICIYTEISLHRQNSKNKNNLRNIGIYYYYVDLVLNMKIFCGCNCHCPWSEPLTFLFCCFFFFIPFHSLRCCRAVFYYRWKIHQVGQMLVKEERDICPSKLSMFLSRIDIGCYVRCIIYVMR